MARRQLNQHIYHDGWLTSVRFSDDEVTLVINLDGHWNNQCEQRACVTFYGVRNLDAVREFFDASPDDTELEQHAEVIGIIPEGRREYLVDLARLGSLTIDCRGVIEL